MAEFVQPSRSAITSAEFAHAVISDTAGILLDWDGCTATANRPRADALEFIARYRKRIAIVSNNSTHLPEDISSILAEANIDFPATQIFLAGSEAIAFANENPKARALVIGVPRMKAFARNMGLLLVQSDANVVVLLRDTKFSYSKLERAINSLTQGARLIIANPDHSHPGPGGKIVPETGALLAAIGACVDLSLIDTQVVGKPSRMLFQRACAALKVPPHSAVMVGDNIHTDIEGANIMGMASVLVAPGSKLSFSELIDPAQGSNGITLTRKQHHALRKQARTTPTPLN